MYCHAWWMSRHWDPSNVRIFVVYLYKALTPGMRNDGTLCGQDMSVVRNNIGTDLSAFIVNDLNFLPFEFNGHWRLMRFRPRECQRCCSVVHVHLSLCLIKFNNIILDPENGMGSLSIKSLKFWQVVRSWLFKSLFTATYGENSFNQLKADNWFALERTYSIVVAM